jgi:hypothetical protein
MKQIGIIRKRFIFNILAFVLTRGKHFELMESKKINKDLSREQDKPCYFFNKLGNCKDGSQCRFSHQIVKNNSVDKASEIKVEIVSKNQV